MKIGNIITQETIKVDKKFNIVSSINQIIEGIPTLIVGIDNALKVETNLNYVNKILKNDFRWTFNRNEKRVIFEDDLYYFIEYCYFRLIKNFEYKFIDVILTNDNDMKLIFKDFKNNINIISYQRLNMVYIFDGRTIFGIDTNQIRYIGKDINKFIEKIKKLSKTFLDDNTKTTKYNNELEMFNNEIKYIPVLYSLNHSE